MLECFEGHELEGPAADISERRSSSVGQWPTAAAALRSAGEGGRARSSCGRRSQRSCALSRVGWGLSCVIQVGKEQLGSEGTSLEDPDR